ncbi:MAG: beta-lactamase induction signal transducer [Alphaproteobacteria bacterium]|nr:beta-lactamase induction signal transducer [Alphaproteobacteria bacterium]
MSETKKYSWRDLADALKQRNSLAMFVLGFSAGLPYVLITGTLNAWFTNENISVATIGVFSWIIIIYSFKFLWSPAVDRAPTPRLFNMGQRRATILLLQGVILLCLLTISTVEPTTQIGLIAIAAIVCTFASASQDVLIDAWRIEVADERISIDLLSAVYQLGYRTSVILGGAGALIIAARIGWNDTFVALSLLMGAAISGVMIAGDSEIIRRARKAGDAPPAQWRNLALTPVILGWAWSFAALFGFMAFALKSPGEANARAFTMETGPFIIIASIIAPVIASAAMLYVHRKHPAPTTAEKPWPAQRAFDALYGSVLAPMADIIDRLGWGSLLVLIVALSYRFTDLIWGAFAYPFYLGENYGALGHTLDEVAIASKLFGALMTFVGIGVGGALILRIGRMPCLVAGAVLAAATNLLFADLATGGAGTDAFMAATGLYGAFSAIQPLATFLHLDVTVDEALARLMVVIAAENLAVGFASAAIVVYLSAIVNRQFAAVQYALLASLGFLLGSLGRGAIGELIELRGFAFVFYLTAALGLVAVAATSLEWLRLSREKRRENVAARPAPAE